MSVLMGMGRPIFFDQGETSSYSFYFCLTAAFSLIFIRVITYKRLRNSADILLLVNGKTIQFSALVDSGNLVRDPLSGCPVIITSSQVLGESITKEMLCISYACSENADLISQKTNVKVRIIPHKTVNGEGILYGFIPDQIKVNGKEKRAVVALDKAGEKNIYGGFDGIVPMSLCD